MTDPRPTYHHYLSLNAFAEQRGVTVRTVRRWLADLRLPGATLTAGSWQIPADTELADPAPRHAQLVPVENTMTPPPLPVLSLAEQLDLLPAFLTIEQAATQLGIPASQIRNPNNRSLFKPVSVGPRGALMIPQAVIRNLRGRA